MLFVDQRLGVQVKLRDLLTTCAIPVRFCDELRQTQKRYVILKYPFSLTYLSVIKVGAKSFGICVLR